MWPGAETLPVGAEETSPADFSRTIGGDAEHGPQASNVLLDGRYQADRVLGVGATGVVYRVHDALHPDRPVALKCIASSDSNPALLGRFENEFRTMTQLRHPNVAAVYDFGRLEGLGHFFTMELVGGDDILTATQNCSWQHVVDLLVQVCRALSFVHSRQLVHLDIKPGNIFVDNGRVKVLDFGVADMCSALRGGVLVGTPMYMAPEVIRGLRHVDHRADLYSLGLTAYHLLCREMPFRVEALADLFRAHLIQPLAFSEEAAARLPSWLQRLVVKLAAKDPDERWRTANSVIDAFNHEGGLAYEVETVQTRASYLLTSQYVARDRELMRVERFIEAQLESPGGSEVLLVVGPSGAGKSRLIRELRVRAQLSRLHFFEAACYEGARSDDGPIVELLEQTVTAARAAGHERLVEAFGPELSRMGPRLERLVGRPVVETAEDPQALRERLVHAVSQFLVELAAVMPFVVYLDDLQWARPGTVEMLQAVVVKLGARQTQGTPTCLALLCTGRDDELSRAPANPWLAELDGCGQLVEVRLPSLTRAHVGMMVESMLGTSPPAAFVARLAEETAGNPFFIQEVMRVLIENGSVFLEGGGWATRASISELEIPTSMTAVFQRRVDMLAEAERKVLQLVSACTGPVQLDVLARASVLDAEGLAAALALLEQRYMVTLLRGAQLRYEMAHGRMGEAVYDALQPATRRRLHSALLDALEEVLADELEEHVTDLAHHGWLADDPPRALRYSLAAGRRALRDYAPELAIEMLGRARTLLESGGAEGRDTLETRCEVLLGLGRAFRIVDRMDEALAALNAAEPLLDEVHDRAGSAPDQARAVRREVARQRSLFHYLRGNLYFPRGDFDACLTEHTESLRLARVAGSPERVAAALGGIGDAEYLKRRMRAAHASFRACVELCHRHRMQRVEAANAGMLAHTAMYFRPQRQVLAEARSAVAISAEAGHTRAEINARHAAYRALYYLGNAELARAEIESSLEMVRTLGARRFEQPALLGLGVLAADAGRHTDARRWLERGIEVARRTAFGFWGPTLVSELARVQADPVRQRETLARGESDLLAGCVGHNHLFFYPNAMEVALDLEDWPLLEGYAIAFEKATAREELPWVSFHVDRARALARHQQAPDREAVTAELERLLEQAEAYDLARPARRLRRTLEGRTGPLGDRVDG